MRGSAPNVVVVGMTPPGARSHGQGRRHASLAFQYWNGIAIVVVGMQQNRRMPCGGWKGRSVKMRKSHILWLLLLLFPWSIRILGNTGGGRIEIIRRRRGLLLLLLLLPLMRNGRSRNQSGSGGGTAGVCQSGRRRHGQFHGR